MSVIFILILISATIALVFLVGFIWSVKSGQFEDTYSPSHRMLFEDKSSRKRKGPQGQDSDSAEEASGS